MKASRSELKETFFYFLRLGVFGFGGPLALVASMQRDLVEKRRWMSSETFVQGFTLIKALPGPLAFQTAVYLGRHRAGWAGGTLAAIALNAPSFALMVLFGMFYQEWRDVELSRLFLIGMQAAALGVILASLKGLAQSFWKKTTFWIVGIIAVLVTYLSPASEPVLIVMSGAIVALWTTRKNKGQKFSFALLPWLSSFAPSAALEVFRAPEILPLAWYCFKAGAFIFGSGLAIVPMMEHDFVAHLGWLTHQEFMDAIAFGQITPGPVVITATFIGYKSLGFTGAVVATVAIFLAPFLHIMTWFPRFVDRLSRLSWISSFLLGAIAAVIGAIVATIFQLGLVLEMKAYSLPIVLAAALMAIWGRLPVWAVIPLGGAVMALIG